MMSEFSNEIGKSRILFVEDELVLRDHLGQELSKDFIVDTAADGEQALRAVLRHRPDLVVTDLLMPGVGGVELVQTLRNTPSTATIPILMTSGLAPDELRLRGFELGADSYLPKPYSVRELLIRIHSMLQSTQLRVEQARKEARAHAELEALAERATLLESITDAFYAVDRQWRITYANQRALDHFGMSRSELLGKVLWDTFPAGKTSVLEREYRNVMLTGRTAIFETISPISKRWIDIHAYPTPQGVAVSFRDITDRKQAEAALRELTANLEQRVRATIAERDRAWSNTQDLLLVVDKDGVCQAVNPAWTRLLGWLPQELVGRSYFDYVHPDDHALSRQLLAAAGERGPPQYKIKCKSEGGAYLDISWVAAPEGNLIYASGRDVSAEHAAHEALRQANARARAIFETSYQYQAFVTPEGRLVDINRTSLASIGCELADVVGRPFWETPWFTATPGMPEQIKEAIAQVAAGESVRKEITINLPAGPRIFDVSIRPVFDEAQTVVGIVPEAIDITDRESAAEQIAQMQKMEAMGQLTGGVAHDFNNLLTPIVGVLDMLRRQLAGDARAERLTTGALQAAERARILIQRLLAFARKQHLEARAVDVKDLLNNMADLLPRTLGPQIQIAMAVPKELPPARVDPNQLELALLNLALNARDAMAGGGTLTLIAEAETVEGSTRLASGRYIRIALADTGSGMDAETLRRSIEPFYTTKAPGQGTGLGLSMVHGLAAQSGGDLLIESELGRGTTATLWLPVSITPAETTEDKALVQPSNDTRRRTILLVDDEPLVRQGTAAMLSDAGYQVIEARSGSEALSLVQSGLAFDALLTDFAMPTMTGVELAHAIRAERGNTPVLMITGFASIQDSNVGGIPRLAKPFRQAELIAALTELLTADRL
jgi:PAS domain S-box-containing protein